MQTVCTHIPTRLPSLHATHCLLSARNMSAFVAKVTIIELLTQCYVRDEECRRFPRGTFEEAGRLFASPMQVIPREIRFN